MTVKDTQKIAEAIVRGLNTALAELRPRLLHWDSRSITFNCICAALQHGGSCSDTAFHHNGNISMTIHLAIEPRELGWLVFKRTVDMVLCKIKISVSEQGKQTLVFSKDYSKHFCLHVAEELSVLKIPHEVKVC
jgi:hypothetical protein